MLACPKTQSHNHHEGEFWSVDHNAPGGRLGAVRGKSLSGYPYTNIGPLPIHAVAKRR